MSVCMHVCMHAHMYHVFHCLTEPRVLQTDSYSYVHDCSLSLLKGKAHKVFISFVLHYIKKKGQVQVPIE